MNEFHELIFFSDEAHIWLNSKLISKICDILLSQTHMSVKRLPDLMPGHLLVDENDRRVIVNGVAIVLYGRNIVIQNWMDLTSMICGFNKMVPHVIQLVEQSSYGCGSSIIV